MCRFSLATHAQPSGEYSRRVGLVAAFGQEGRKPAVKILVELESHTAGGYVDSGITRSRVTSAA
jgi:hypothetical protein